LRARNRALLIRAGSTHRRRRLDLVSSPFLFSTLRWVSADYERALTQYHAFVLLCFIAGVLLFCRAAGVPWWASLFLLAGLLLWYRGFEADLRVGNVNSIQLLALAVIVAVPRLRWLPRAVLFNDVHACYCRRDSRGEHRELVRCRRRYDRRAIAFVVASICMVRRACGCSGWARTISPSPRRVEHRDSASRSSTTRRMGDTLAAISSRSRASAIVR
jgi:hypothetical protein